MRKRRDVGTRRRIHAAVGAAAARKPTATLAGIRERAYDPKDGAACKDLERRAMQGGRFQWPAMMGL